jgi:hypothetical protein
LILRVDLDDPRRTLRASKAGTGACATTIDATTLGAVEALAIDAEAGSPPGYRGA